MKSMKGFNKTKLMELAMDQPNVNWNVLNILDDKLESENFPKTLILKIFLEDRQPT